MLVFEKDFTQQEPIPEEAIEKAVEVLRSGRLHRYNLLPGEKGLVCELEESSPPTWERNTAWPAPPAAPRCFWR